MILILVNTLFHYDYKAQQTGFVQPYADSPMDNEQVGEEVYISMINKAEKILLVYDSISNHNR